MWKGSLKAFEYSFNFPMNIFLLDCQGAGLLLEICEGQNIDQGPSLYVMFQKFLKSVIPEMDPLCTAEFHIVYVESHHVFL